MPDFTISALLKQQGFNGSLSEDIEKVYAELMVKHTPLEVLILSGHFCELVVQLVSYKLLGTPPSYKGVKFEKDLQKIKSFSHSSEYEEALSVLVPRALSNMYSLRSKKTVAHKRGSSPTLMDVHLSKSSATWVLSELLAPQVNSLPIKESKKVISQIEAPYTEYFEHDGERYRIIYPERMSVRQALLQLLSKHNGELDLSEVIECLSEVYKVPTIQTTLKRAAKSREILIDSDTVKVTNKGYSSLVEIIK